MAVSERVIRNKVPNQFVPANIREIIQGHIQGDQLSQESFFDILQRGIRPISLSLLQNPEITAEIVQDATSKIMRPNKLKRLLQNIGSAQNFPKQFEKWSVAVALNHINDNRRRIQRTVPEVPLDTIDSNTLSTPSDTQNTFDLGDAKVKLEDLCISVVRQTLTNNGGRWDPNKYTEVLRLRSEGKSFAEIANQLTMEEGSEVRETSVRERLSRARRIYEDNLFAHTDFKRKATFKDDYKINIKDAFNRNKIKKIQLFGTWYTFEDSVLNFQKIKAMEERQQQTAIDSGWIQISKFRTQNPRLYSRLSNNAVSIGGKLFVSPEQLQRKERRDIQPKERDIESPGDEYVWVARLENGENGKLNDALGYAIKRQKIPVIRSGKFVFIKKGIYEQWKKEHSQYYK